MRGDVWHTSEKMIVTVLGLILVIGGIFVLLGGAMRSPSDGGAYSGDSLLIGGPIAIMAGVILMVLRLL
jgi:hypothetical protein